MRIFLSAPFVGAYTGAAAEFFRLPDEAQPYFIAHHLSTGPV